MALKKGAIETPKIFTGTTDPNTARLTPSKIGDIYIDLGLNRLMFAKASVAGANAWGTAGTA
jgi:hypothetical protein